MMKNTHNNPRQPRPRPIRGGAGQPSGYMPLGTPQPSPYWAGRGQGAPSRGAPGAGGTAPASPSTLPQGRVGQGLGTPASERGVGAPHSAISAISAASAVASASPSPTPMTKGGRGRGGTKRGTTLGGAAAWGMTPKILEILSSFSLPRSAKSSAKSTRAIIKEIEAIKKEPSLALALQKHVWNADSRALRFRFDEGREKEYLEAFADFAYRVLISNSRRYRGLSEVYRVLGVSRKYGREVLARMILYHIIDVEVKRGGIVLKPRLKLVSLGFLNVVLKEVRMGRQGYLNTLFNALHGVFPVSFCKEYYRDRKLGVLAGRRSVRLFDVVSFFLDSAAQVFGRDVVMEALRNERKYLLSLVAKMGVNDGDGIVARYVGKYIAKESVKEVAEKSCLGEEGCRVILEVFALNNILECGALPLSSEEYSSIVFSQSPPCYGLLQQGDLQYFAMREAISLDEPYVVVRRWHTMYAVAWLY